MVIRHAHIVNMFIKVTEEPIQEIDVQNMLPWKNHIGAIVTFSGHVRATTENEFEIFTIEHYPSMTEKKLEEIGERAIKRFSLINAAIIHRVGEMNIGDEIVRVIAYASHRQAAFDGASFMMDYLKTRAPFWKKEADGSWVDARLVDEDAFSKWNEE